MHLCLIYYETLSNKNEWLCLRLFEFKYKCSRHLAHHLKISLIKISIFIKKITSTLERTFKYLKNEWGSNVSEVNWKLNTAFQRVIYYVTKAITTKPFLF